MSTPLSPASRLLAWRPRNLAGRMARWGVVIVIVYLLIALLTPLFIHLGLLPDVNAGLDNPIYAPPSWHHWCGTDRLGRDVCSRTLAGSGVALQVVAIALVSALVIGVPLGMVSGYLGGWIDRSLVLLMDTLYTLQSCCSRWCWPSCSARACPMQRRRCVWSTCRSISGWCAIRALR